MQQPLIVPDGYSADWIPQAALGSAQGIQQVNVSGPLPLVLPIKKPDHGQRIVGVGMRIDPAGGHGALPATKPRLRLMRQDTTGSSAPTAIGDVTDNPGSVGAYEANHAVEATGLNQAVSQSDGFAYYAVIDGEASTNAVAGLVVQSLYLLVVGPTFPA